MDRKHILSKTLLTKVKKSDYWFGYDFNMNLFRGCVHGCIYCDSRSDCYQVGNFEEIKVKINSTELLKQELSSKRTKGVICMGSMSDPYNPLEREYELTRKALELIADFGFGVMVITKSNLVLRDIDLLKKINKKNKVVIGFTITTFDDDLGKIIEPNVNVSSKRFEAIKTLVDAGITSGVLLMPLLPFINDNVKNVIGIVEESKKVGASFVYPLFGVTIRDGQREYFYDSLDKKFPGIKEKYISTYGNRYYCESLNKSILEREFKKSCEKNKILYKMNEINLEIFKNVVIEQISLF
ncbi:MAG: radical SAM protein [Candidatus Izemoplasmatales bacterium]|nr:radical SAM protein [Candidatus Izemoplasmatales bacterium]